MSYNFLDKTGLTYFWSKIKAKFDSFSRNDLAVIDSREYSGIYGSANDQANASFYFGGIKPNNYYDVWKVKFRVYSNVPNQNEYKQYSDVEYYGSKNDLSYKIYNRMANTGGRCYYYHNVCRLNSTGFNAGYKHILGMGLRASNNPTSSSYPRYFKIELLETDKCTFTFYDSMKKISAISEYNTTNYSGISEYDGCNNGLRESGDDNDISNLRIENGSIIAGTNGIKQNALCAMDSTGKYQSFTTTDGTGTSKTVNTSAKFRNPMIIFKNNSGTNYANGAEVGTGYQSYYASPSVDLRYSCNNSANFTKNTPTYLECTKDSDGYFSVTSNIILQTGFTSGRYYIHLGNTRRDQIYLMDLQTDHPIYYYDGSKLINENELKADKTSIPTNTSQLTNDSHFNYSIEKPSGTIDDLAAFTSGKPGITGSISLIKKSSGIGSEIPAGWYNFFFSPHRTGSGGDNFQYGTIFLTPMNFAGKSWILRRTSSSTTITDVKEIITRDQLSNFIQNSNFYINTHPENTPVLIPFMHNDIAFLTQRGGSCKIYYDGVEQTIASMNNMFDGSPSYMSGIKPTTLGITEIVVELTLHQVFAWTNTIYCDFGASGWRAKSVKIEVMNTNFPQDVWTVKGNATGNSYGNVKVTFTHTPVGASNAGGGFNKIKFTFSSFNSDDFRISQLGVYNYGSMGLRETSMSRGRDDAIFRSITPFYDDSYSLGSSTKKWSNVYATTFQGNATSATKATQDEYGNNINTTYQQKLTPGSNISITNNTISATDTTYSSKAAASGGTDVSLVTTGEKYTWNNKQNALSSQTAYQAKGTSTKVPQITTNSLGQVTGITEVTITQPTVNNGTLTIQKNGTDVQTFTANQSTNATANITVPTKTSDLTNDSGYITDEHVLDVKINGTSILANKAANIVTNTAYDATTNKIATMADVGSGGGIESSNNTIENIVSLTKAEYNALQTKETKTLYNITDDINESVRTGSGTADTTNYISAVENNHWERVGQIVTYSFTMTVKGTWTTTTQFVSGLPKPVAQLRFLGVNHSANTPLRLQLTANGELRNAWSTTTPANNYQIEGYVSYITSDP